MVERPIKQVRDGALNAVEMIRLGRLTESRSTPFTVVHTDPVYRLRHYGEDSRRPTLSAPILLVPPLMVASEIYDMSPDVSAVLALLGSGLDVWLVDFGAPEHQEGGLERTLDDHILAVNDAIDRVRERTGSDVHLAGYSQGGMFCYQVTAYRRTEGIASLITFGSPVHIHRNLPGIHEGIVTEFARSVKDAVELPLEKIRALPGFLTSTGFKLLSVRKELQQFVDFIANLHDREALEQREGRRRFLAGEGFVAWPGPAFRQFVRDFVIQNRMLAGGFVIAGQTLSLADISCPLLYFVGLNDAIARPSAVRPVRDIVSSEIVHEVTLKAGHFGIVVGSRALAETWPTVAEWMRHIEGVGPLPRLLRDEPLEARASAPADEAEEAFFEEIDLDLTFLSDAINDLAGNALGRLTELTEGLGSAADTFRYRLPRLRRLSRMSAEEPLSFSRELSRKARKRPDQTFFLWEGRAFSYAEADRRIDAVARGFIHEGVRPGDRVAIYMRSRPSYVTAVCALNRLGAVAVLLSTERGEELSKDLLALADVDHLASDPEHLESAKRIFSGPVLSLGGGGPMKQIPDRVRDMESIDPDAVELPAWYQPNPGRAKDLAMILITQGDGGKPRLSRITNRRWAFAAYGAAAAATLTEHDTVYCCLPLSHPAGMLVSVGSALVGGSRLAFSERLEIDRFNAEVRRYGVTVVFYAGEMLRILLDSPPSSVDRGTTLRLFAGSGMRADIWHRLRERFETVGVLEFYAATEGNAILANASGRKIGSVGRPLPGSTPMVVARYNFAERSFLRDSDGWLLPAASNEPGVLISKVDEAHPLSAFEGLFEEGESRKRIVRSAFEPGDLWVDSGMVFRVDDEGDHFILDRLREIAIREDGLPIFSREIEDRVLTERAIAEAALVSGEALGLVVRIVEHQRVEEALISALRAMPEYARPSYIRVVDKMPLGSGFRPDKAALIALGEYPRPGHRVFIVRGESIEERDVVSDEAG